MPFIFLIFALATSYLYFGKTYTLLFAASIGISYLCLVVSTAIICRKQVLYKALTTQSFLFLLLAALHIVLFYYLQGLSSPVRLHEASSFIYKNPSLIKYGPCVAIFLVQTLFIALYLRIKLSHTLLISAIVLGMTYLVLYVYLRYWLAPLEQLNLAIQILKEFAEIHAGSSNSEVLQLINTLHEQAVEQMQRYAQ